MQGGLEALNPGLFISTLVRGEHEGEGTYRHGAAERERGQRGELSDCLQGHEGEAGTSSESEDPIRGREVEFGDAVVPLQHLPQVLVCDGGIEFEGVHAVP